MKPDLHTAIAETLYLHEQVHLPGLGAFVLSYKPAVVDAVQGQVLPPSKEIKFNPNLVMDDGVLVNHLREKQQLSLREAQQALTAFVDDLKQVLDRREIVEMPGIGRFYRDYENNLRFLADGDNFHLDAFGLPVVQHYPVARQAPAAEPAAAPKPKAGATPPRPAPRRAAGWQSYRSWLAGVAAALLLLVISLGLWRLWRGDTPPATANDPTADLPADRLNVSPTPDPSTAPPPAEASPVPPPVTQDRTADTEAPTPAPNLHTAVIAVGMFGDANNARRLVRKLSEAGYEPYTRREGALTRVGAQVTYTRESELDEKLREIRRGFGAGAFVMEVDGAPRG